MQPILDPRGKKYGVRGSVYSHLLQDTHEGDPNLVVLLDSYNPKITRMMLSLLNPKALRGWE